MSYNRFHKPMERYVPIPFEQLMVVGKELNAQRRQAEEDLHNYIKSASEFTSLLEKDVDSYYKTAMNDNIQRVINEATQNPEVMKSSAWRAGLANAINSVNYGQLAKYKASAEQAKVYNAAVKKLAAEGKMYPGWEPNYFATYSTDDSGVFNATPLAWQSLNDDIHPYVDNLEESFIRPDGYYNIMGVSRERTIEQVEKNFSEIMNHPRMQRRLEKRISDYKKIGKTANEAYNDLVGEIYTAAQEKAWEKPEINKLKLLQLQEQYRANRTKPGNGKKDDAENMPSDFTVNAQLDASSAYNKGVNDYVSERFLKELDNNPLAKQKHYEMNMKNFIKGKGDYISMFDIPEIAAIYDNVKNNRSDVKTMFIDSFNDAAIDGKITPQSINTATSNILNRYGAIITNPELSATLQLQLPNKEGKGEFTDTGFGENVVLSNSKGLRLASSYLFSKTGKSLEAIDPVFDKIDKDLSSGKFSGIVVRSVQNILGIPEDYNGEDLTGIFQVSIPEEQLRGYTEKELEKIGAFYEETPETIRETRRASGTVKTASVVPSKKYVTFYVKSNIPTKGLNSEYLNAAMHKTTLGTSGAADIHPYVQQDAYDDVDILETLRFLEN